MIQMIGQMATAIKDIMQQTTSAKLLLNLLDWLWKHSRITDRGVGRRTVTTTPTIRYSRTKWAIVCNQFI
jgi:hypothetical protein